MICTDPDHTSERAMFSQVDLFGRTLPNRLAVAPMSRVSAIDGGLATDRMKTYYGDFARGGFGIVITEGTYTDEDASQGYDRQPGIANDTWFALLDQRKTQLGLQHQEGVADAFFIQEVKQ